MIAVSGLVLTLKNPDSSREVVNPPRGLKGGCEN